MKIIKSVLIFIILAAVSVLAASFTGCSDTIVNPPVNDPDFRQARSELDFYTDKDLRAESGAVIILDLEDLNTPPELVPYWNLYLVGIDLIPFTYTETAEYSFRLDDLSDITATLINENTLEVVYELKPGANEISVIIPAGDYLLYIESLREYGSGSSVSQIIFIQPDGEQTSQKGAGSYTNQFEGTSPNDYNTLIRTKNCSGCNLGYANLKNMNLSNANLSYSNLGGANLYFTNLINANLTSVNFSGTYMQYANLSNSNLKYAYFYRSDLRYANFCGADKSDMTATEVVTNAGTKCWP